LRFLKFIHMNFSPFPLAVTNDWLFVFRKENCYTPYREMIVRGEGVRKQPLRHMDTLKKDWKQSENMKVFMPISLTAENGLQRLKFILPVSRFLEHCSFFDKGFWYHIFIIVCSVSSVLSIVNSLPEIIILLCRQTSWLSLVFTALRVNEF